MTEPFYELDRTATEHAEFRRDIDGLLRWMRSCDVLAPDLARRIDQLRRRLVRHFEHEELSWSARAEELDRTDFCAWTVTFTAQHRDFDARLAALAEECAAAHAADEGGLRNRLEALFLELLAHERGESHLLARHSGVEDEAELEP